MADAPSVLVALLTISVLASCSGRPVYVAPDAPSGLLVAPADYRKDNEIKRFSIVARIITIDGARVGTKFREVRVSPGCHVVEVEVTYHVDRVGSQPICLEFAPAGECREVSSYSSGRVPFAIAVAENKRYELTTQADGDALGVYFVEVEPENGSVAWFPPVDPQTRTCHHGIPLGNGTRDLK